MSCTESETWMQNDALHLMVLRNLVVVLAVFRLDIMRTDYDGQLFERCLVNAMSGGCHEISIDQCAATLLKRRKRLIKAL